MLIRSILLTAALAAAPGSAQAETARFDAALEAVQTKVPPPTRPSDGCYYGTKCTQSPRYGQICWRVACPTNTLIRAR
jgi:hypothetical protein